MGKRVHLVQCLFVIFFSFPIGVFYTNCTSNSFNLQEQAQLADQQQPPNAESEIELPPTPDSEIELPSTSNSEDPSEGSVDNQSLCVDESCAPKDRWVQVPIRTRAQLIAGISGGEGMQEIYDMTYSRSNPLVAYLTVDQSQVYKTIDGGKSWARRAIGFLANGGASVAVHPLNEKIVFVMAGGLNSGDEGLSGSYMGIVRSIDGGLTWKMVKAIEVGLPDRRNRGGSFIVFNKSGTIIYAGGRSSGLLRSRDGGETWSSIRDVSGKALFTGLRIRDIQVDPKRDNTLYVSTSGGFFRITGSDGNAVQTKITSIPNGWYPLMAAIHPNDPNTIFVNVGENGVYKTIDGGSSWSAANIGLDFNGDSVVKGLKISPADGDYLFLTLHHSNKLYYSHDGAKTWHRPESVDELNQGGLVSGSVTEDAGESNWDGGPFALHPTNKNIVITNGSDNRILKSEDGGKNWRYSASGYSGGRASNFGWSGEDNVMISLLDYGLYISSDAGKTFRYSRHGRHFGARNSNTAAICPSNAKFIVAAVGTWSDQIIAITEDSGVKWTFLNSSEMIRTYKVIGFHPQKCNIIYADNKKITRSNLGAYSVTNLSKVVSYVYPKDGNIVYSKQAVDGNVVIFRSKNGGIDWQPLGTIIGSQVRDVVSMTTSPINPDKVYVTAYYKGIYIIDNGMVRLSPMPENRFGGIFPSRIAVDPREPSTIYVGTFQNWKGQSDGIYRSTDGGNTWKRISYNLGDINIWSLAVNPYTGFAYIGTSNGTWKIAPP